jgi:hypothetical protein
MVHLLWAHNLTDNACILRARPYGLCRTAASRVLHGEGKIGALVVRFSLGGLLAVAGW